MKKRNFFYAAFMAVALAFGFTSCSSSDDDPIIIDPTVKETITDALLKMSNDALDAPAENAAAQEIVVTGNAPIKSVTISNCLTAIVHKAPTKAINDDVIVCNYKIEGTDIIIEAGKYVIKVSMIDMANIMIDEQVYAVTRTNLPAPTEVNEINLCREWKNAKYMASVYFDKLPVWGAKAEEQVELSNVSDLSTKVITKLTHDSDLRNEGFKMLSNNLVGVNFLNNGTVFFSYQDGKVEESTWKWIDKKNGKLNTTLDGKNVNVDIRFKKGATATTVNTVYFIIDANLQGVGGLGVHDLTGQLICKMND